MKNIPKLLSISLMSALVSTAGAISIPVENSDFDAPALGEGAYTGNNFTDGFTFVFSGVEYPSTANTSQWDFVGGELPSPANGNQLAFMNGVDTGADLRSYMYQDVGLLAPNTTYTLTVAIGARKDQGFGSISLGFVNGFSFDALNPTNVLAQSGALAATTLGGFNDVSFSFTTGSVVSGDLTIFIQNVSGNGLGSAATTVDNVRLDAVAAVPEPKMVGVAMMLVCGCIALYRRRRLA